MPKPDQFKLDDNRKTSGRFPCDLGRPIGRQAKRWRPETAVVGRLTRAIDAYLKSVQDAIGAESDSSCDQHASAHSEMVEALAAMRTAPTVLGLADPSGVPWPFNVVRKYGLIFVLFTDPDGDGSFLVPFSESEIVDLD